MMNRITMSPAVALLVAVLLAFTPAITAAKIRVVASVNDLGSIASSVGGSEVEVVAIAKATLDPHRVEVLPSYMVRVTRAQLYLKVGLGLDLWADQIIDGARNDRLQVIDCSTSVEVLDKPTGKVDAAMGDVHPAGNPHYWLDPRNGGLIARQIAAALGRIDPEHAADFARRAEEFAAASDAVAAQGAARMAALPEHTIVTYHASWVYLAHAFGLKIVDTVEPKPGIPPTGRHLDEIRQLITERKVAVLLQEPYFSAEAGEYLARETRVRVAKVSPSCDSPEAGSYFAHFDHILDLVAGAAAGAPK